MAKPSQVDEVALEHGRISEPLCPPFRQDFQFPVPFAGHVGLAQLRPCAPPGRERLGSSRVILPTTGPDHGAVYTEIARVGNVLSYTNHTTSDTKSHFYPVVAVSPDGESD